MNKGHDFALGPNGAQEQLLGLNEAEASTTETERGEELLNAIARICDDYEQATGSKARHSMAEIASLVRNQRKGGGAR